jgi:hypothetical protein
LLTDAGAAPGTSITPGSGSQLNTQCVLNGSGSSVSLAGNVLTLNLSISFQQASFSGSKTIYLQATSPSGSSGWQQGGSWTVPAGPPALVSVTPSSGSGSSQTFSFVYSDPRGYAAITSLQTVINSSLSGSAGCYLLYYPGANVFYLSNDAVTAWLGPVALGQPGSLQNSQCSVDAGSSSASGSGANLTVNLALSFKPTFGGAKNVYMDAADAGDGLARFRLAAERYLDDSLKPGQHKQARAGRFGIVISGDPRWQQGAHHPLHGPPHLF